ncbi:tetratricopeptide repeat protein [Persicimonas caeni]|uniref:Tetratricopeptide repeat protein n=1 Tax=Persicimonas caeni TaxID=2292766 RepID=A0A4Y6PXF7_PERCE|nr:serine/threonine-protein kinase [Persicimonas caeni]QDG52687.1 tetratricopeptide repeat protein [Persicimonas caeni]QED33909.1 tetratricopeptide repeat protein [Persicimonas caeni]
MASNVPDNRRLTPIAQLGPFDLLEFLGKGAMGQVWRARHREQDVPAAIKVVTEARAQHEDYGRQFRQEVRAVAGLSHPGVVMVFDYGQIPPEVEEATLGELRAERPYLAMELCPRGSLADIKRQLSFRSIRSILLSLLDALAHAHARGVVHRDIKPANILLGDDTDWTGVKLTDFGLAFVAERVDDATTRGACGTPAFMSPEQFRGRWRDVGPWTDLYSIGCLAYYLVCGEPVYVGRSIVKVAKKHLRAPVPRLKPRIAVPDEFEGWVRRLIQKNPLERFRNAADAAWQLLLMSEPDEDAPTDADAEYSFDSRASTLVLKPFDNLLVSTGPGRALRSSAPDFDKQLAGHVRPTDAPLIEATTAPLSTSWQHMVGRRPSIRLLGAGLGLYGLRHIPMVGREGERDALWNTLCEAIETRSPRAALVRGPSGVGKSFLAQWLCERALESGAAVHLQATHSPNPGGAEGLPRMLARHFRAAGLDRADLVARLRDWYRSRGVNDAYEWDALAELISPATETDVARGQRKIQFARPQQRYALVARLLELMAQKRAVIVWLDDLQWSTDSLAFLRFCLDSELCARLPILLLGTIRDEALADESVAHSKIAELAVDETITHVGLDPLSKHEQADLIEKLLYLSPALARKVADRTGGNPLFAVQLIGDWVDRGVLEVGEEGFVLADGEHAQIPDDIFDVWSSRLDEVLADADDATMCALELAAVLGMEVDDDEWRACLDEAGWAYPEAATQTLLQHNLLEDADTGIRFVHGMLRESLERRAEQHDRLVAHHFICAQVLQRLYDDEPQLAERLGRHLLAAESYQEALEPLLEGAKARGNAMELDVALVLLDLRLAAIDALELPQNAAPRVHNQALRALTEAVRGNHSEAEQLATQALELAEKTEDPLLVATCSFRLAQCHQFQGNQEAALPLHERAKELVRQVGGHDHLLLQIDDALGIALIRVDRLDEAAELLEQARRRAAEQDKEVVEISILRNLGSCERRRSNLDAAEAWLREALQWSKEMGSNLHSCTILFSLGDVVRLQDKPGDAEQFYAAALAESQTLAPNLVPVAKLNLAFVYLQTQRFPEARTAAEKLIEEFERNRNDSYLPYARAVLLPCLAHDADWNAFETLLDDLLAQLDASGRCDADLAIPIQLAGELASKAGRREVARRALRFAALQWEKVGDEARQRATLQKMETISTPSA